MLKNGYILMALFAFVLFAATACNNRRTVTTDIVAQVGDAMLTEKDINVNIPQDATPEDSIRLVESYINTWVLKQVKIAEAEKVLESTGVDIESMVADYRNSLLIKRLEQYYVDRNIDSVITDDSVREFYDTHSAEFKLDRNIVKGRIVKMPADYRQQARLKELMASSNPERQQDFMDLTIKGNLVITEFDEWVSFDDVLNYLPTIRGKDYEYLMAAGKVNELSDGGFKYYIQITEYIIKGEPAPLEWVDDMIRKVIYNQRSAEIIKDTEDSLYNASIENKELKIYLKTN